MEEVKHTLIQLLMIILITLFIGLLLLLFIGVRSESEEEEDSESMVPIEMLEIKHEEDIEEPIILSNSEENVDYSLYYIVDTVNLRKGPSKDTESLGYLSYGECYEGYNQDGWVYFEKLDGYVKADYCATTIDKKRYEVESSGFKSFMDYKKISKGSVQGRLQSEAKSIDGIRMVNGRYCVAVGTKFNCQIGQYIDLILDNGVRIPAIVSDIKADKDTRGDNMTSMNGCVSEFVVETSALSAKIRESGDISNYSKWWRSPVKSVIVYGEVI